MYSDTVQTYLTPLLKNQTMSTKKPPLKVELHFWGDPRYTIGRHPVSSLQTAREIARNRGHDGIRVVFPKPKGAERG